MSHSGCGRLWKSAGPDRSAPLLRSPIDALSCLWWMTALRGKNQSKGNVNVKNGATASVVPTSQRTREVGHPHLMRVRTESKSTSGIAQECPFYTGVAALLGQPRRLSAHEFVVVLADSRFLHYASLALLLRSE